MRLHIATILTLAGALTAAALAQPARRNAPNAEPPPILTRHPINHRDWTIITDVKLYGFKSALCTQSIPPVLGTNNIVLDSLTAVFPLMGDSSMHHVYRDAVTSQLRLDKRVVDTQPQIISGYQGPTQLMEWHATDIDTPIITLHVEIPVTSYDTRIDEDRAFQVPWPPGGYTWDPELAANLQPQLFVRPDHPSIQRLLNQWTNGKPRKVSPYYLAKYLAGKVVEYYKPDGRTLEATGRGATAIDVSAILISGFRVDGSVHAAETGKGSPLDAANLLTALYRAAGIPARVVIAYDVQRSIDNSSLSVRAWTEFYLYDPRNDRGDWIPVDIQLQRQFSNRAPPIKQRWQFFGHNEQFKATTPLAYHWIPPASITNAGPPALWGWIPDPVNPLPDQQISITVIGTPKHGADKRGPQ